MQVRRSPGCDAGRPRGDAGPVRWRVQRRLVIGAGVTRGGGCNAGPRPRAGALRRAEVGARAASGRRDQRGEPPVWARVTIWMLAAAGGGVLLSLLILSGPARTLGRGRRPGDAPRIGRDAAAGRQQARLIEEGGGGHGGGRRRAGSGGGADGAAHRDRLALAGPEEPARLAADVRRPNCAGCCRGERGPTGRVAGEGGGRRGPPSGAADSSWLRAQ